MKKLLLYILLSFAVVGVYATTDKKPVNTVQETQQEVVSVVGDKVYITAKAGEEINIFALTGQNVYRTLSEGGVLVVEDLPTSQILIVRIGAKAYKVKL